MKRRYIMTTFIICQSIFCWLAAATAAAQPLSSRAATANSYRERSNAWFAKGEYERAIADYDSPSPPTRSLHMATTIAESRAIA